MNRNKDYPDHQSDATHKTKQSKKSVKSNKSGKSDKSDHRQRLRDNFECEKTVNLYKRERNVEEFEKDFEYRSDEESIYNSFAREVKTMPLRISKRFTLNTESGSNKKIVKDMIRRFTEKTQTYEFMIKFEVNIEKTDESSITEVQNIVGGEIVDQKERRRFIRKEMKEYKEVNTFNHSNDISNESLLDKELFNKLIDLVTKSNQLLNVMYQDQIERSKIDREKMSTMSREKQQEYKNKLRHKVLDNPPPEDTLKYIEMQMNKANQILSKAKLVCVKLDKIFLIIPYTYSKIELRMRNLMTNNRDTLDAISHFMNFYLVNKQFQDHMMDKYT